MSSNDDNGLTMTHFTARSNFEGHIISRSLLSVVVVCFKCLLPKLRVGMRFYDDGYGSETHLREVPIYVKSRIVTS